MTGCAAKGMFCAMLDGTVLWWRARFCARLSRPFQGRRPLEKAGTQDMEPEISMTDARRLRQARGVVESELRAIAMQLARLKAGLVQGDLCALSDTARKTEDIRQWLRLAQDMEMRLEKHGNDRRGGGAPPALDLDDARAQIGSRLDRLRRAGSAGCVPRCDE